VPQAERATDGEEPSTIYFKESIRSVARGSSTDADDLKEIVESNKI
jgi:hypothetical protein